MSTFIGEYQAKLDAKGRLSVPAAFLRRLSPDDLSQGFVLKEDLFERCLALYPMAEWQRQTQLVLDRADPFTRAHAQFSRAFGKGAVEVTADAAGRVLVPRRLVDFAGIEKEVVVAGNGPVIEIWSAEGYRQMWEQAPAFEDLARAALADARKTDER